MDVEEQIKYLEKQGWIISNKDAAYNFLKHTGFYSFGGESLTNKIVCNNDFERAIELYYFDSKLRNLLFLALEKVEISLRRNLSVLYASKYGAYSHWEGVGFLKNKEDMVGAFNGRRKERKLPDFEYSIYESINWLLFPGLKKFCESLDGKCQNYISKVYGMSDVSRFYTWIGMIYEIRNDLAHFNMIWNKTYYSSPHTKNSDDFRFSRLLVPDAGKGKKRIYYSIIVFLYFQYEISEVFYRDFIGDFLDIMTVIENDRKALRYAGIPEDWRQHPLLTLDVSIGE